MLFRLRQLLTAALVANALRPVPGFRTAVPVFLAGWGTSELAPHLLAATAADTARHARRRGLTRTGALLALANAAGLAWMLRTSAQARGVADRALVDALGVDYLDEIDTEVPRDVRVPWRRLLNPFRMREPGVHVERDIAYDDTLGRRGLLDVYTAVERPAGLPEGGAPVLVQVHGGGWTLGAKDTQGIPLMQHLAARGWVCVAPNYRLAPQHPFPAQIVDVKKVLAWVHEHIAAYGGDPSYVAITGGSAGGHLAALAALTPGDPAWQPGFEDADTSVQVAVPHYGVYDLAGATGLRSAVQMRDRFLGPRILRRRWREDPEPFEAGSPLLRVGPEAPDFFVVHGRLDSLVQVDQARLFVEALRRTSRRSVVYAELPGAQHAFDVLPSVRSVAVVRAVDRFLHWHWARHRRALAPAVAAGEEDSPPA